MDDRTAVVRYLRNLTVAELRTLLTEVQPTWNAEIDVLTPCSGCGGIIRGPHGCPGFPVANVSMRLVSFDATRKRDLVKALVEQAGVPFRDARELVDLPAVPDGWGPPSWADLGRTRADSLRSILQQAGGIVEFR